MAQLRKRQNTTTIHHVLLHGALALCLVTVSELYAPFWTVALRITWRPCQNAGY